MFRILEIAPILANSLYPYDLSFNLKGTFVPKSRAFFVCEIRKARAEAFQRLDDY